MPRYSKPVWQMIKEALERLGEAFPLDVIQYIKENYPEDRVNERTIRAQLIASCVNHSSAHYYPNTQRFSFLLRTGKYRTYNPEIDGQWVVEATGARRIDEELPSAEIPYSKMDSDGRIILPKTIQKKLNINPNDIVAFIEDGKNIILKKGRLRLDFE